MHNEERKPERLLPISAVREIVGGKGKSTIYGWIKSHGFPPPVQIGPNSVAWRESEIDGWIRSRPVASSAVTRQRGLAA